MLNLPMHSYPRRCTRLEAGLLAICLVLMVLAMAGPAMTQPSHAFADQRTLLGLPHAMDVLSNLPFALLGLLGAWRLWRLPGAALSSAQRQTAAFFFAGLLVTATCSSFYHWQPDDFGLGVDRAGMAVAFAGLLGLAAAGRVSERAGQWLAVLGVLAGAASVGVWMRLGNVLPWAVLQFGGMGLVLWLACLQPLDGALALRWGAVIAIYALAKAMEQLDAPLYHLSAGLVSGHSIKHVAASCAALPIIAALLTADARPTGRRWSKL